MAARTERPQESAPSVSSSYGAISIAAGKGVSCALLGSCACDIGCAK